MACAALGKLRLSKVQKADDGKTVVVPTNSVMGALNGTSATSVRDDLTNRIRWRSEPGGSDLRSFCL